MLSLLGGLNAATERILKLCMMRLPVNRIIVLARKAARYAGTLLIYGKRRFMRSIIDRRSRSSLEFCQLDLDRRRAGLDTTPKRCPLISIHYSDGTRPLGCF